MYFCGIMMQRTKTSKKAVEEGTVVHTSIIDRKPLVEDADIIAEIESPRFMEKVRNRVFAKKEETTNRPTFRNDFARQVYYLAKLGATQEMMAKFFNVSVHTVSQWQQENPDFYESVMQGKWLADISVADSLYKMAHGYEYEETEVREVWTKDAGIVELKRTTKKFITPDTTAAIFWLKNRMPDVWNDTKVTKNIETRTVDIRQIDMKLLTDEEKRIVRSVALKKLSTTHGVSE